MDASDTQKYYKRYSVPKGALYGAAGGLVAGWVMAPFMMITMTMIGASQDAFFSALGDYFVADENAFQAGLAAHMAAGVVMGAMFGATTAGIERLRVTSFAKGVSEGLATGAVAFAVLFLPLTVSAFPSLVEAIAQGMTEEQRDILEAEVFPALIGLALLDHLAYGAVLGVVTSGFVVGVRKVKKIEK